MTHSALARLQCVPDWMCREMFKMFHREFDTRKEDKTHNIHLMLCVIDFTRCEYHSITIISLLWSVVRATCAVQKCKAQRCSPPLQFICAARAVFVWIFVRVKWLSSFSHEFSIKPLCTNGARFSLYLFKFLRAAWGMNRQECAANTSYSYTLQLRQHFAPHA